ncbi:MAG: NfeD family protein [Acidimicrobiales bacterium]|nr:NfeD family protein [Acidimicrobiales bacterium]
MDDTGIWMLIWIVVAAVLGIGEIMAAGSFFMLPFAVGALAAFGGAAIGVSLAVQLVLFIAVSGGSFLAMRPLAHRLNTEPQQIDGIGARRLIGAQGRVIEAISADGGIGLVRLDRQEWRAQGLEGGTIEEGARVKVVEVRGTRVVVFPVELPNSDGSDPPGDPSS